MSRPFLSVVIPAYNEASRIPLTLVDIDRHLSEQEFESEIIVVVSQGTDNTPEILKRFQTIIKNMRVIHLSENRGRGYAVKTGVLAAKGQWRLVMDADNSTSIIEVAKMLPYVTDANNRCEIAIGSRFVEGAHIDPPAPNLARVRETCGHFFNRILLLRDIKDASCGFKLFSSSAADQIFSRTVTDGWSIDSEALIVARQLGYAIKEFPVYWAYDPGTHRTSRSAPATIKDYLKITANVLTGKYKASSKKTNT